MLMWFQHKLLEHWAVMPALVRGPVRVITGQSDASRFAKDFDLTKVSVKEFNELLFKLPSSIVHSTMLLERSFLMIRR